MYGGLKSLLMVVVYPGSLGLNESFTDLCVRAYSSMLARCVTDSTDCSHWTLYLLMCAGITMAVSTAAWLHVVFIPTYNSLLAAKRRGVLKKTL